MVIKTPKIVATPSNPVAKLVTGDSCSFTIEHSIATSVEKLYLYRNCTNTLALSGSSPNSNFISFPYSALYQDMYVGSVTNFLDLSIHMGAHVMAVSSDGTAFSWGKNDHYQLGNNNFYNNINSNNLTLYSSALGFSVSQVATGFDHSVILLSDGMTLYGVGGNAEGQLSGMFSFQGNNFDVQILRLLNVSSVVNSSRNEYITQVVAGHRTTFVLTNYGRVFGSGDNKKCQISSNSSVSNYWDFEQLKGGVMDRKRIRKIVLGTLLILLADDFTIMMFNQTSSLISLPNSELIMDAFSSESNTYFLTQSGNIYGMGSNLYFELSIKYNVSQILQPVLVFTKSDLGGMPYLGSCGNHFASVAVALEWSCNGVSASASNVCSGNGLCLSQDQCLCKPNIFGQYCEIVNCNGVLSNTTSVCSGNGICNVNGTCSCYSGYSGVNCEIFTCFGKMNNDTLNVCNGRGNCVAPDTCQCNPVLGFYGSECQYKSCFDAISKEELLPSSKRRSSMKTQFCTNINKLLLS